MDQAGNEFSSKEVQIPTKEEITKEPELSKFQKTSKRKKDTPRIITVDTEDDPLLEAIKSFEESWKRLTTVIKGQNNEEEILLKYGSHVKQILIGSRPRLFKSLFPVPKSKVTQSDCKTTRPTRTPALTATKKFFAKKRKRSELMYDLLCSSDSLLCALPLSNIINAHNFNLLIPAKVKDSLVALLPECDTKSHETVTKMFSNPEFLHSLIHFQRHLHSGTFDTSDTSNLRKSRKVQEIEPWKENHFEHVWGQRLLSECLLEEPPKTQIPFSYSDAELCDLPMFAEPISEISSVSVSDIRQSLIYRDTNTPFNFLFGDKMEHYRRRKAVLHRNPHPELFIRSTNISCRQRNPPSYQSVIWKPMEIRKWSKELNKIRKLQGENSSNFVHERERLPPLSSTNDSFVTTNDRIEDFIANDLLEKVPGGQDVTQTTKEELETHTHIPPKSPPHEIPTPDTVDESDPSDSPQENHKLDATDEMEMEANFNANTPPPSPPNSQQLVSTAISPGISTSKNVSVQNNNFTTKNNELRESISTFPPKEGNEMHTMFHSQGDSSKVLPRQLSEPITQDTAVPKLFPTIPPSNAPSSSQVQQIPQQTSPMDTTERTSKRTQNFLVETDTINPNALSVQFSSTPYYPTVTDVERSKLIETSPIITGRDSPEPPIPMLPPPTLYSSFTYAPPQQFFSQTVKHIPTPETVPFSGVVQQTNTPLVCNNPAAKDTPVSFEEKVVDTSTTFHISDDGWKDQPLQTSDITTPTNFLSNPNHNQPTSTPASRTIDHYGSDEDFIPDEWINEADLVVEEPKKSKSTTKRKGKKSFRNVAYEVLKKENRPLPAKEIVAIALKDELFTTSGKTPENTLASVLYKDIQTKKNPPSLFVKINTVRPVAFALREWDLPESANIIEENAAPE